MGCLLIKEAMFAYCILFATFCSICTLVRRRKTWRYSARKAMAFGLLMADIPVYVSCKFEMYIFKNCSSYKRKCMYCVSFCTEYLRKIIDNSCSVGLQNVNTPVHRFSVKLGAASSQTLTVDHRVEIFLSTLYTNDG